MGGGLSARARDKREAVRMQAAAWFARGTLATGGNAAAADLEQLVVRVPCAGSMRWRDLWQDRRP
jgi:hypothetical protein